MCDAYPGMTPAVVVTELHARFTRARDQHQAAAHDAAAQIFDRLIAGLDSFGGRLTALL